MSWPEQLARSKAARAGTTDAKRRLSVDDSADSPDPDRIHPEPVEAVVVKKAIILPIMGKHHKEAMLRAAAAKEELLQKPTAEIAPSPIRPVPILPISPEINAKKRGPGRPRKTAVSHG